METEITTQDIIKMLPFDEAFKTHLLQNFDRLTPDQKHDIEDIIWEFYGELFELKSEKNLHLALIRVKEGEEKLDADFYKRVEDKTEREMTQMLMEGITESDLAAARKAMELIVREIQASKKN